MWGEDTNGGSMYCVMIGNIVDGSVFYGPFEDMASAKDFAEHQIQTHHQEYLVINIYTPITGI